MRRTREDTEKRHFTLTLPDHVYEGVCHYKAVSGHLSMAEACRDLIAQALSLRPSESSVEGARLDALNQTRRWLFDRVREALKQITAELEIK